MDSLALRLARRQALERLLRRLDARLVGSRARSNRVSWLRVLVLVAGLIAAYAAGAQFGALAGWAAFAVAFALFLLVVLYHRRLERSIRAFTIWRNIKSDTLARLTLDWPQLPAAAAIDVGPARSLAIDLDLTGPRSLHQLLDTTISREGSRLLADWLTRARPDLAATEARQQIVRELAPRARFRERFRLNLMLVMQDQLEGGSLLEWLDVEIPARRLGLSLPFATLLVAANLALLALWLLAGWPPYWLIPLALYLAFYFISQSWLDAAFGALLRLDDELGKFGAILRYLETSLYAGTPHLAALCAPFRDRAHAPSSYTRRIHLITTAVGLRSNLMLGLILNLLLPWDFLFALLAARERARVARFFPQWVQIIHQLDALIALGNFAGLNPDYAFPVLAPGVRPTLQLEHIGHPLIPAERKVSNDFTLDAPGEIAIITGSNMAGKSTFLKTVGVNLCLAYAGAPVSAARFVSAPFRLYTCMRIADSVVDGFSYFYAEVKCLKQLLEELQSADPLPLLYLIDEIFRGTNNRERLLGSRAYLRAVAGQNGCGLLATHDLELATLADESPRVHNYHFRDRVEDGALAFDYKIHSGPCPTTNALKIMALEGLPVEGA